MSYSGKMIGNKYMTKYFEPVEGKIMVSYEHAEEIMINNAITAVEQLGLILDPEVVICPTYMTETAVGADVFASEETIIEPGEVKFVKTGIKANFDGGIFGLFPFIRSSIPKKKGLMLANGVGVIEQDYYSNPDNDGEICFMFYNFRSTSVTINRFERIGQLVLSTIARFDNAGFAGKERGASGSTGN